MMDLFHKTAPVDPLTGIAASRFGVYVHFPYCLSKCPYCDFASAVAKEVPHARYARAVVAELTLRLRQDPAWAEREVDSIYFGGGTPSLWEPDRLAEVLRALRTQLKVSRRAEVTVEANPGASDAERFAALREAGVNRLSIGVQSLQPAVLKALGREHSPAEAVAALGKARQAGFRDVSLDFIYGAPGQSLNQVESDARAAVQLGADHLSAYALTLEPEALAEEVPLARQVARGERVLPPEEVVVEMGRSLRSIYAAGGWQRYEISNFARPGHHSTHNCAYWTGADWLALGVGATGTREDRRYANHRSPEVYLKAVEAGAPPEAQVERLSPRERFEERLAMGLRLTGGVNLAGVCQTFGVEPESRKQQARVLVRDGWAEQEGERLRLTDRGSELHSAICARLM